MIKQKCWSYAYPYFIDYAYKYNKKLFKQLLSKIKTSNALYQSKIDEIKKEGRSEYNWINDKIETFKNKYFFVNIYLRQY